MKQTAVKWLLNAIETKNGKEFSSYYSEFVEQAKEIHKDEIINAYETSHISMMTAEQYYNETFNTNEK
jgi:hypothetical protein